MATPSIVVTTWPNARTPTSIKTEKVQQGFVKSKDDYNLQTRTGCILFKSLERNTKTSHSIYKRHTEITRKHKKISKAAKV